MRTTITINDALLDELKRMASETGSSVSSLIEDSVRRAHCQEPLRDAHRLLLRDDYLHGYVVILHRKPREQLKAIPQADGEEGPVSEETVEIAGAVAEALASAIKSETQDEGYVERVVDGLRRHLRHPGDRLLQSEAEGSKGAGIPVNVNSWVAALGPRDIDLLAGIEQPLD